jgi:hypothetical protein
MTKRKLSKYYTGMLLRHKKYNFIIKLIDKHRSTRWLFEVVEGTLPDNLKPDTVFDPYMNTYHLYSYDSIRSSFIPLTDSPAGRLLYGS